MLSTTVIVSEAAEAVRLFSHRFGEKAAWCLSRASRPELLTKSPGPVRPELVWKVRSWMGLQGVESAIKTFASQALVEFDWAPGHVDDLPFASRPSTFPTKRRGDGALQDTPGHASRAGRKRSSS